MVSLYILENDKKEHYVGITSVPLPKRLSKHNRGEIFSTRNSRPWKIIYSENYNDFVSARAREEQIKSWHGGNAFKKLVAGAAESSNGRTTDFGSVYFGSNPSSAALVTRKEFGGVK